MWVVILSVISIVAFAIGQIARTKVETILVSQTITVSEALIKKLGLYPGLALHLTRSEENNVILVWATDAAGVHTLIGHYTSPVEYDILRKKDIRAFVYSVYGDAVVVEIKLNEAL
ncbi:hypothetical protein ACLI09_12145 [Flavobacterium sp. RHBU_24]|uniref:hypothetical protein n=1 Tax=Flavobacterium sp. RHBU_24 TaxID=3391185 RepID=UPI003984DDCB